MFLLVTTIYVGVKSGYSVNSYLLRYTYKVSQNKHHTLLHTKGTAASCNISYGNDADKNFINGRSLCINNSGFIFIKRRNILIEAE